MSQLCRNFFLEQPDLVTILSNGPNGLIFQACDLGELLPVTADIAMNYRENDGGRTCLLELQRLQSRLHPHPT